MKELSIEEKAKRYDEAMEKAKNTIEVNQAIPDIVECVESLFPELTENKEEKIRKIISDILLIDSDEIREILDTNNVLMQDIDTWLEKQGNQDNDEDIDILHRFSFYSYKDEPNVLYLSGFYVNEEYRNKGIGTKILEVTDEVAKSLNCYAIRLKTKKGSDAERLYRTHGYNSLATEDKDEIWLEKQGEQRPIKEHDVCDTCDEKASCVTPCPMKLVGQKPTDWSEEDEEMHRKCICAMRASACGFPEEEKFVEQVNNWLKSLRYRFTWKPSDEQITWLYRAADSASKDSRMKHKS